MEPATPQTLVANDLHTPAGTDPAGTEESLRIDLAAFRKLRTYFLHHSVGSDIIRGIRRIAGEVGAELPTHVTIGKETIPDGPALISENGGNNMDPRSKIDAFAITLRKNTDLQPDIALMKLCFVDVVPETDVSELFAYYARTLKQLKEDLPGLIIGHVTVPLLVRSESFKSRIKRLIGRDDWADASNIKRNQFSTRLRREFDADPILDLERLQSTTPTGGREVHSAGGTEFFSLFPGFSNDGGHLNQQGDRRAGREFVRFVTAATTGQETGATVRNPR